MVLCKKQRLSKIEQFLGYEYGNSTAEFDATAACRRLVGVLGVNGVLALIKRVKVLDTKSLVDGLPLVVAIPLLRKITKRDDFVSWILGLGIGLTQLKRQVPHWFVASLSIESLSKLFRCYVNMDCISERRWIILRQIAVSILLPIFYHRNLTKGRLYRILFEKRSPWKDFALLFAVWNLVKVYQNIKKVIFKKKTEKNHNRNSSPLSLDSDAPETRTHYNLMTRMLIQRLEDLNELSGKQSRATLKELVCGFFFSDNFIKYVKWTLWRQIIMLIFNGKHSKCLKPFHKSTIIMLSFMLLSDPQPLDINWPLVKQLVRSTLSEELRRIPQYQKPILFAALNVSYLTKYI